jgi:DNA polymerase I
MEGLLLDNDFAEEEDKPYVRLYIKRGEETIAALDPNFETYLYVVADHLDRVLKLLGKVDVHGLRPKSIELVKKTFLGKKVDAIKVAFNRPGDMPDLRHAIRELPGVKEMYEFDIPPARRYLIDRRLTPMSGIRIEGKTIEQDGMKIMILDKPPVPVKVPEQNLKILSFDIEVYNPAGSPRPDKDPIIMVSLADNRGLKRVITWKDFETGHDFVEVVKDEKELLERFVGMVRKCDPDIMMGYNTDLFDFPYIRERARRLKVKLKLGRDGSEVSARKRRFATASRVRGRLHIDVYTMVHFLATIGHIRLIHYNLEEVYKYMLGKGKPDFEFTEFVDAWKQGGERARDLLEYSLSDAIATLEVGLELLPLFFELTHIIRQSPFDVSRMTPGQLVEWLLISEAHNAGELVPARPVGEEFEERLDETYVGAYVMEPAKGLHEDLVVFDYRSLYPSIIVTHNIDPSTLNCDCCKPSQVVTVPELGYKF